MVGIGIVCEQTGLTPRAIRFYEEHGLISPSRDGQKYRRFDDATRRRLELIGEFRQAGLSIDVIYEIFALEDAGQATQRDFALRKLRACQAELDRARKRLESTLHRLETQGLAAANGGSAGGVLAKPTVGARR